MALSGCFSSDFHYVKSSEDHTYFKVPSEWKLYDSDAVFEPQRRELSEDEFEAFTASNWQARFDGSPAPALKHTNQLARGYPAGIAMVQAIGADTADTISIQTLRNIFLDVDTALDDGSAEMVAYQTITRSGGFRGIDMVVRLNIEGGDSITLSQLALLNVQSTKVYALAVSCTSACYQQNRSKIQTVLKSWTVEDD